MAIFSERKWIAAAGVFVCGFTLSACKPDRYFIDQELAQDLLDAQTATATSVDTTNTDPGGSSTNPSTAPYGTAELELIRNDPLTFLYENVTDTSSLNGYEVIFDFRVDGEEVILDNGSLAIRTANSNGILVCTFIGPAFSHDYLCLHSFNATATIRSWYAFDLVTSDLAEGIFEFCDQNVTVDECQNDLQINPDGDIAVLFDEDGTGYDSPPILPYLQYWDQGQQ